jgi:hypothetical protein
LQLRWVERSEALRRASRGGKVRDELRRRFPEEFQLADGTKIEPFLLALIRSRMEEPQFVRSFDARFRKEFASHSGISTKKFLNFYSKAAKLMLREFEIGKVLERTSKESRDFARIVVRAQEIDNLLERYKNYIPELVPDWASGKEYSDNLDAFIPAFSSTLQASLATILKGLVSSDDLEKIEEAVENTAKGAPHFEPVQGWLKFRPLPPKQPIRERKAVVRQKCEQAKRLCERQANEHPDDEGGRTCVTHQLSEAQLYRSARISDRCARAHRLRAHQDQPAPRTPAVALEGSAPSHNRGSGGLSAGRAHQFGGSASGTSCASLASADTSSRMTRSVTS